MSFHKIFLRALFLSVGFILISAAPAVMQTGGWTSNGPDGIGVYSVSVSATDPSTMFIGTWAGVYKSIDSGVSWTQSGLIGRTVTATAIDPVNPNVAYALTAYGSPQGVYK